jgi:hypothetical protein
MKRVLIFVVSTATIALPWSAEAWRVGSESCAHIQAMCMTHYTPDQCKVLYEASLKEGGTWGSPAARAASKTVGNSISCHTE